MPPLTGDKFLWQWVGGDFSAGSIHYEINMVILSYNSGISAH